MNRFSYTALPEEAIYVDLPDTDGLRIKGILRGSLDQPLIVQVHGLPGSGNELLPNLAVHYYSNEGFSSLRLFLYDAEPKTRDLADCTLQTHADDFDTVITYLHQRNVPKVFAVGHSYGGATILCSKAKLDGVVLWDPTHGLVFQDPEVLKYDREARIVRTDDFKLYLDGYGYIEPKAIEAEQAAFGDTTDWAAHKGYPLEVISAGKGAMTHLGAKYIEVADAPKKHVVIDEAHHQFEDSDEVMLRLFAETTNWFKEILDGERG